jgi:hypothetical protein
MAVSGKSDEQVAIEGLELILDEFFELDFHRFKSRHSRARAEAGPSLMGGPRGIDRWTYGHVRQHIDDCLREVSVLVLEFGSENISEPVVAEGVLRPRLARHLDGIFEFLEEDRRDGSAHEYSVLPSREALSAARRYVEHSVTPALDAIARGFIDPRLKQRFGLFARAARFVGGTDRLILIIATILFVLSMWSVL